MRWRPDDLSQIADQETFFSTLGLEVETQVDQLAADLAGTDLAGEQYLAKLGRLRMARLMAEEQVLHEMVLSLPDSEQPSLTRLTFDLPAE